MGLRTESRTIDGIDVTVTQHPAIRGLKLGARLTRAIGPTLGYLRGMSMQSDTAELGEALGDLFSRLEGDELTGLLRDVFAFSAATVDGKIVELTSDARIDMAFEGRVRTMIAAALFAIEVNFADFFGGASSGPGPRPAPGAKSEE